MMEKVPMRNGYGQAILELSEKNPDVMILDADVAKSTRAVWVRDKFPEHFLDMGISEQDIFCQDFKAQILTKMVIDVLDEMSDQSDVLCFRGIIMGTVVAVVIEKGAELMEKSPLVNLIPMLEPPAAHALQES